MNNLLVITGPTASGKTALSIEAAKKLNGEIINADSMQIYKYMDIGTAKPTLEEREGIPHYMMDIINPDENYSVADYCQRARLYIDDILNRGKLPVLVGGTGLYIDSIVNNIQFCEIKTDFNLRHELLLFAEKNGNEKLYDELKVIDPESAKKIELNDTKRIVRALEVYKTTNKTLTYWNDLSRSVPSPYKATIYIIDNEREILYNRIDKRVDIMFERGLLDEVKSILNMGVNKNCTSMQAIGYKETSEYLDGIISLEEAKNKIKQGSRRYAKRQLTWFRRNKEVKYIKGFNDIDTLNY